METANKHHQAITIATNTRYPIIVRLVDRNTGRTALQDSWGVLVNAQWSIEYGMYPSGFVRLVIAVHRSLHRMIIVVRTGADYRRACHSAYRGLPQKN